MTQSQKGHGVKNTDSETSSASVLVAGERRQLLARARFTEQVEPRFGEESPHLGSNHLSAPPRNPAVLVATDSSVPPREVSSADSSAPRSLHQASPAGWRLLWLSATTIIKPPPLA